LAVLVTAAGSAVVVVSNKFVGKFVVDVLYVGIVYALGS
jgi:hypothetical protein